MLRRHGYGRDKRGASGQVACEFRHCGSRTQGMGRIACDTQAGSVPRKGMGSNGRILTCAQVSCMSSVACNGWAGMRSQCRLKPNCPAAHSRCRASPSNDCAKSNHAKEADSSAPSPRRKPHANTRAGANGITCRTCPHATCATHGRRTLWRRERISPSCRKCSATAISKPPRSTTSNRISRLCETRNASGNEP